MRPVLRPRRPPPGIGGRSRRSVGPSVPGVGFEPTWSQGPEGFKPSASNRFRHPGGVLTLPVDVEGVGEYVEVGANHGIVVGVSPEPDPRVQPVSHGHRRRRVE